MPKDGQDERPERGTVENAITALRARAVDKRRAAQEITLEAAGLDHAADLLQQLLDADPPRRQYDTVPLAAVAVALSDPDVAEEAAAAPEPPVPAPMRMARDHAVADAPKPQIGRSPAGEDRASRVLAYLQAQDRAVDFEGIRKALGMRYSTLRRAIDQHVEAGRVVRYGPARGRGVSYWAAEKAESGAAAEPEEDPVDTSDIPEKGADWFRKANLILPERKPEPAPEPVAATAPSNPVEIRQELSKSAAPAPRRGPPERDPRTLPGRIVLEALNDAGEAGMTPTSLREETGLEPMPFRMVMEPMVESKLISRLSGNGQVRYVLLLKGTTELKRLRELSP